MTIVKDKGKRYLKLKLFCVRVYLQSNLIPIGNNGVRDAYSPEWDRLAAKGPLLTGMSSLTDTQRHTQVLVAGLISLACSS